MDEGKEYLHQIKENLEAGRNQHKMGRNLLAAFGYVRRRATVIDQINITLDELGLVTTPKITTEMPLEAPRIIFRLKQGEGGAAQHDISDSGETDAKDDGSLVDDEDESSEHVLEHSFRVHDLASAQKEVECVPADALLKTAYTKMVKGKYSQLVVASSDKPFQQDIKGILSYQSIVKAMMIAKPEIVGDCVEKNPAFVQHDEDLEAAVTRLKTNDVVLVIGQDKRLQGIVTAWDLAEEFAQLVDPFRRLGEIEERLKSLMRNRLDKDAVSEFLGKQGSSSEKQTSDIEGLTLGQMQSAMGFPEHWEKLGVHFDRKVFVCAMNKVRQYRNQLMHFGGPLNEQEKEQLANFCDMVREIPL